MVEKAKAIVQNSVQSSVQVPVWVFLLMVPIFIALLQVIVNQTNAQTKLQTEMEINKASIVKSETSIEYLRATKVDAAAITRLENTLDRIEQKIDDHINLGK